MSKGRASLEAMTFKDVSEAELRTLASVGLQPLLELKTVDEVLKASEEPMPVVSIGTSHLGAYLPHIWMGLGMTEPGKGLRYVREQDADRRHELPIHGLAVPVDPNSVSSVKFHTRLMPERGDQAPKEWWEHWQQYRFTQHIDGSSSSHDYERAVGFPPFATWFKRDASDIAEWGFSEGVKLAEPVIVEDAVEAAEISLEPYNAHAGDRHADLRHRAAIFVGEDAVRAILFDSARLGVPAKVAPRPYQAMIETVARELGLE